MRCSVFAFLILGCLALAASNPAVIDAADDSQPMIRVGVIGLDTSHAIAFTKELSLTVATAQGPQLRVVAAYPYGSHDIESSASRIPGFTEDMKGLGVEIVDSVAELLKRVDCVLLETNDGRLHLEQAREVFAANKPVFIDKPAAASLAEASAVGVGLSVVALFAFSAGASATGELSAGGAGASSPSS